MTLHLTREEMDAIADAWYSGARHGIGLGYDEERRRMLERCKDGSAAKRYEERLKEFTTIKGAASRRNQ